MAAAIAAARAMCPGGDMLRFRGWARQLAPYVLGCAAEPGLPLRGCPVKYCTYRQQGDADQRLHLLCYHARRGHQLLRQRCVDDLLVLSAPEYRLSVRWLPDQPFRQQHVSPPRHRPRLESAVAFLCCRPLLGAHRGADCILRARHIRRRRHFLYRRHTPHLVALCRLGFAGGR